MIKGTVKFYNEAKGFGYIVTESGTQEILVQKTGLKDKIRVGDEVMFETKKGKKGLTAVNVKIA